MHGPGKSDWGRLLPINAVGGNWRTWAKKHPSRSRDCLASPLFHSSEPGGKCGSPETAKFSVWHFGVLVISQLRHNLNATIDANMPLASPDRTAHRPIIRDLAWDIGLNATIPVACYYLAKQFISPSELTALLAATIFPICKSIYDPIRRHRLDPVAILVLLGIAANITALFFGGDPRLLLTRESFFTGSFGVACLISLLFPRPIMFYFGRHFMAGKDPQKREMFDARWKNPIARRAHRLITTAWGLVFVGEFVLRLTLVYNLPAPIVLVVSPVVLNLATILLIIWTFWYASRIRKRVSSNPARIA